jgi:hypothetical protein
MLARPARSLQTTPTSACWAAPDQPVLAAMILAASMPMVLTLRLT